MSVSMYPAPPLWTAGCAACAPRAPAKKHRKSPEGLPGGRRKVEQGRTWCVRGGLAGRADRMIDGERGRFPGNCVCPRSCVEDSETEERK